MELEFTKDGIETIAKLATEINSSIENIGARRLHTIIEKVLDEISFSATDRGGEKVIVDNNYVTKNLGELAKDTDLSNLVVKITSAPSNEGGEGAFHIYLKEKKTL